MTLYSILATALVLLFTGVATFLALELRKKFGYMQQFMKGATGVLVREHHGSNTPGMAQIVLTWDHPFKVLIGFDLVLPIVGSVGFDYYGFAESRPEGGAHVIVIETYLGKKAATFKFLMNHMPPIGNSPRVDEKRAGELQPTATYKPHWYQAHLGI